MKEEDDADAELLYIDQRFLKKFKLLDNSVKWSPWKKKHSLLFYGMIQLECLMLN